MRKNPYHHLTMGANFGLDSVFIGQTITQIGYRSGDRAAITRS
jgi:hypothetical protein